MLKPFSLSFPTSSTYSILTQIQTPSHGKHSHVHRHKSTKPFSCLIMPSLKAFLAPIYIPPQKRFSLPIVIHATSTVLTPIHIPALKHPLWQLNHSSEWFNLKPSSLPSKTINIFIRSPPLQTRSRWHLDEPVPPFDLWSPHRPAWRSSSTLLLWHSRK